MSKLKRPKINYKINIILLVLFTAVGCGKNNNCEQMSQLSIINDYPGVIIGSLSEHGALNICAFGYADILSQQAMKVEDKFHIASVTKLFTATAIFQLYDAGKLDINDKITSYLDFPELWLIPDIDSVTILNLLDHSSGIYGYNNDPEYIKTLLGEEAGEFKKWDPIDLLALSDSSRVKPFGKIGTGHFYGDANYVLLGLIIEKVSSMPFTTYIKNNIFTPLNLNHTGFYGDVYPDVKGYLKRSDILKSIVTVNPVFPSANDSLIDATLAVERIDAAASIVSNASDLLEFAINIYMTDFLSEKSKALLINASLKVSDNENCLQRITKKCKSDFGTFITMEGDGPGGINLMLVYNSQQKQVIVAFTNIFGNFDELDKMREEVLNFYFNEKQ